MLFVRARHWAAGLQRKLNPEPLLRERMDRLRPELWLLEAAGRPKGDGLRFACTGTASSRASLAHQVFGESYREVRVGRVWLWNLRRAARRRIGDDCLIAARVWEADRRLLGRETGFFIPSWIEGSVSLPIPPQTLKKGTVRADLRRIRQAGYRCKISTDPVDFEDFYHRMHVPYIEDRHTNAAHLNSYSRLRTEFERCKLVLVEDSGQAVAGALILYGQGPPRFWLLGVRDAERRHVKRGALAAVYWFVLQCIQEEGYDRAIVGLSAPFLADGVLRYKMKWGMQLGSGIPRGWVIEPLSNLRALGCFLAENPFVFHSEKGYAGAVFVPSAGSLTEQEVRDLHKRCWLPGLERLIIYTMHGELRPDAVPLDLRNQVDLRLLPQ